MVPLRRPLVHRHELPLQNALTYPERHAGSWPRLQLEQVGKLTFANLVPGRYPCFDLAMAAAATGGTMPSVLSAADDEAVKGFLEGRIAFNEIPAFVERAMEAHRSISRPTLEDILLADAEARQSVTSHFGQSVRLA